jgi:hypothetical protein
MRALLICLALVSPAAADCMSHEEALAALERVFGETVQVRAMQENGTMMELVANPETGTWTAVITDQTGLTCGAASGVNFKFIKPGDPA